jgi:Ser-tRNA(Ala) deacylase AlaX
MREDSEVISFMIQELRKNNDIMISEYNMMIEKHDHLLNLYQALLNKIVNQNESVSIEFIHDEDTSKSVVKEKLIISKKLLDLSIFIDEKDSLIDD